MSFVHLHTHTEYSLLDSSNKIKNYVSRVKELGMNAAAITDHGAMYGVIDFYKECHAQGIKPILGCEVYVAPGSRFDKEAVRGDDRYHHLILLAENDTGYQNLMKIVSIGFTEGFYYKPRVDKEVLRKYHEGIIATSACLAGEIASCFKKGMVLEAEAAAKEYVDIFGKGNFFLELQDHMDGKQTLVNQSLIIMSDKLDIPLIATNDCHYTYPEDARSHDLLLCLQTGKTVNDEDRMRYEGGQYYVKSEEEMLELFAHVPQALENTQAIADRCNVEIEFHKTKLPHFDIPSAFADSWEYLNYLSLKGLEERYPNDDGTLKKQLEFELSVIQKMGFVDYFLIVRDYINYARSHGIPVGPGRGSAAGAIVSYCLHITDIEPTKYGLLFERFLNPERVSMPDIDVDFAYEGRQQVIDYVVEKYGRNKCVQIITFGTLQAKGVIRDVCRAMDLPYSRGDQLARLVPPDPKMTLTRALDENNDFKSLYDTDPEVKEIIDMCLKLEGLPRHTSKHAAGILITPEEVDRFVPLSSQGGGEITTEFTMNTLEELGLLKMDFLGLRTLTVIDDAVRSAMERHPGLELDINAIDLQDPRVLDYIGTGATEGVFQLESPGMRAFMKQLLPGSFEDVIAGIALFRPGPMDFIPKYIEGKNHPASISYETPELTSILEQTYGCIVYQEQVMQIFRDLAGYSLGQADSIRRAMSKKKEKIINENRLAFVSGDQTQGIEGCVKRGISKEAADHLYDHMLDFANYAFNKSHAACYAVVTMQTAFLKYYYPVEFMAALMTSFIDNTGKIAEYCLVCRNMKIEILPPDINEGYGNFTPAGERSIRFGLSAIKALGRPVINGIVEEREERGKYKDIKDFLSRTSNRDVNRRAVENLIKAGALDSLPGNRKQKLIAAPSILDTVNAEKKNSIAGQMSLFDLMESEGIEAPPSYKMPDVEEYPEELKLSYEKEVTGIYVSGHPLTSYQKLWERHITARAGDFVAGEEGTPPLVDDGSVQTIGGLVTDITIRHTKKGDTMAIITLEDLIGSVEIVVWPKTYQQCRDFLEIDSKVFVKGRVRHEDNKNATLAADSIWSFADAPVKLYVRFETMAEYEDQNKKLMSVLNAADIGPDEVIVYLKENKKQKKLRLTVNADAVRAELESLFGADNVAIV